MHTKFYNKLEKLFNYHSKNSIVNEILVRGFCYSEFQKKKLLFIGINPSYLSDAKRESHHYNIDEALKGYPKYFGKFKDLVKNSKYEEDWTYIDLFFFRETDQNKIKYLLDHDIDFLIEQLNITNEIINDINPELIVVCNSGASNFFGINKNDNNNIWMGYNFSFDEDFGVEIIRGLHNETILRNITLTNNIIGKPIIFSSILTYLDIHSKKRLNWIIRKVGDNFETLKNKY